MIGIGTTLNHRFTIERELGRGGMGAVYRATDAVLGRAVAIKTLKDSGDDEAGKRFRLEAQILARLLHDHVVRLYDIGDWEGVYFLVMEEVEGTSFSRKWRQMGMAGRLRVVSQVADALGYAHHLGIVHRDVKPGNVLLTPDDQAKLSDFGLSMTVGDKNTTGAVRGTPLYMSPEQAQGGRLDHRSDLYSLGVMLYECATGSVPFSGHPIAVLGQHVSTPPPPPRRANPRISPDLETLILGLLAKHPDDRPSSGVDVAKALREESEREVQVEPTVSLASHEPTNTWAGEGPASSRGGRAKAADTVKSVNETPDSGSGSGSTSGSTTVPGVDLRSASPLVRAMIEAVLQEPRVVSAEERYLCGQYLAYLLGGSRRQGILMQRPLDTRNADRARFLLAMAWLTTVGPEGNSVERAASLLDGRSDVRPLLNPIVVMKYLDSRSTGPAKKNFRLARKHLQNTSYAARSRLLGPDGTLNPGMMPYAVEDLHCIKAGRDEVDDHLVARWNRVSEVWCENAGFRDAVLRYATSSAYHDPASGSLWPEVVYPLIERARWQRVFRAAHERVWDYISEKLLLLPDAGVRLDRAMDRSIPDGVVAALSLAAAGFRENPRIGDGMPPDRGGKVSHLLHAIDNQVDLRDLARDDAPHASGLLVPNPADPYRFTQAELREALAEATNSFMSRSKAALQHRFIPVGPYHLVVIPSARGRVATVVTLRGMGDKQIEMTTPPPHAGVPGNRPVIAVWVYQNASVLVAYLDFQLAERHILWHAPNATQFNYDSHAELDLMLEGLGMMRPDRLDLVLSEQFDD